MCWAASACAVGEKQIPPRMAARDDTCFFPAIDGGGSGVCAGGVNVLGGVGFGETARVEREACGERGDFGANARFDCGRGNLRPAGYRAFRRACCGDFRRDGRAAFGHHIHAGG